MRLAEYTFGMFGISFEHIIILGIILLIVGPKRLPELGNTMGKAIKNFKDSFAGVEEAAYKKLNETRSPINQTSTQTSTAQTTQNQNGSTTESKS